SRQARPNSAIKEGARPIDSLHRGPDAAVADASAPRSQCGRAETRRKRLSAPATVRRRFCNLADMVGDSTVGVTALDWVPKWRYGRLRASSCARAGALWESAAAAVSPARSPVGPPALPF